MSHDVAQVIAKIKSGGVVEYTEAVVLIEAADCEKSVDAGHGHMMLLRINAEKYILFVSSVGRSVAMTV